MLFYIDTAEMKFRDSVRDINGAHFYRALAYVIRFVDSGWGSIEGRKNMVYIARWPSETLGNRRTF